MNWSRLKFWKKPPVVMTQWGPVSEWARKQAALNMKADPQLRQRVIDVVQKELRCSDKEALAETMRRYPEAFR